MDTNESRKELGLDLTKNYVCFVGNLAPWQGVEYLIKASPLILSKCPNTNFLIVGDGMMKEELVNLATNLGVFDKFIFTGSVPYNKIALYINSSNVCVAPFIINRNEKIGLSALKIYEYIACSVPVVASDIKGIGDLLRESNGGIAVLPENSSDLAEAIIKLIIGKELQKRISSKGHEFISMNHSWASVSKDIRNVFSK